MDIENIEKDKCTGCGSCADVCPAHAVTMVHDSEGFAYPKVDRNRCMDCGLCRISCPAVCCRTSVYGEYAAVLPDRGAGKENWYAAYNRNEKERKESSSGGMFSLFAKAVLGMDGVVCGAYFDPVRQEVCHIIIEKEDEIRMLRSSKYIQSDMTGIYKKVKKTVRSGKPVLFTGTPCQTRAVARYMGEEKPDLLYTADLFCHGISSGRIFRKYVSETLCGEEASQVSFRNKDRGWERYGMEIITDGGHRYRRPHGSDPFLTAFFTGLTLRPSCYGCRSKGFPRESDITMGDFWMADRIMPDMNDHRGLSLLVTHTGKGERLLGMVRREAEIRRIPEETVLETYAISGSPVKRPAERNAFFGMMQEKGFLAAAKAYAKRPLRQRIMFCLRKILVKTGIYKYVQNIKRQAGRR